MINTGLLLRLPFESDYSAYRRFLIANHTQSPQSVRAGLAEKLPTDYGTRCSLPDLAQQWEQKYCNQYQIPYEPPVSTSKQRAHLRNCPTCARLGYHSFLFQYPWCRYCPIHQKPLVHTCPICKKLWPIISELQTTRAKCSMCGIHYDIKKLSRMLSSTKNEGFEVLSQLDQAIEKNSTQNIHLIAVPWSPEGDIWRSTNRPESLDWVSLVYPRPQRWERVCELIGAPLQPVCIRRYAIKKHITETYPLGYYSLNPSRKCVERAIIRRILRGLTSLIKRLSPRSRPSLSGAEQHIGYLQTLDDSDIFRISFNTWRVLFSLGHHQHSLPYARYFFKPEFASLPVQPIRIWEMNMSRMRFKVPETLSMWLYSSEFWRCYLHLLGHLKTLNDALKKGYTWREYYNRLPEDAVEVAIVSRTHRRR